MGLFDFLKRENDDGDVVELQSKEVFSNITIESKNVNRDLERISSKYNIDINKLDFTIISTKTFYRFDKDSKYKLLQELNKEEILNKQNFLNPDFSIRQIFKINVYEKKSLKDTRLRIVFGTNKDYTKISAIIKKNSNITYYERLESDILNEINNKKIKQGMLINIFDEELKENIKKVISHIMVHKSLNEDIKIDVCEGYHRVQESGEYINFIYKDKKIQHDKNIGLKNRSNLYTVKKDELIIEVFKPKTGQDGRNCKGEFLSKIVLNKNFIELNQIKYEDISITENIKKIEYEDKIEFFANTDGYIIQNGAKFDISDDIVVESVNLKTTGSIEAKDSDIKVNINNNDETIDAVASGVVLNTKEVKAKGNVGSNAKINADIIEIDGQTHQTSRIEGNKIKIHLHKGYAEGDRVDIGTLEGGVVVGDEVFVDTLSGGEIRAKKIYINRLISNATLIASELIELNELDGNSNKFIIDPKAQRGYDTLVERIEKELNDKEYELNKYTRELKSIRRKILSEQDSIEEIKNTIRELKEKDRKAPAVMVNRLKDDKANKIEFNRLVALIKDIKAHKAEIVDRLKNFNNASFDSTVIINTPWKEYNEVIFRIVEPKREVVRAMDEKEIANRLGLKVTKDNEYIIANLD